MQLVAGTLGRLVAISLLGLDVQEDRLLQAAILVLLLDVRKHLDQSLHVVAVNGADVVEAELLEQLALAAGTAAREGHSFDEVTCVLVELGGGRLQVLRKQGLRGRLQELSAALEALGSLHFGDAVLDPKSTRGCVPEGARQGAHWRCDLVVEGGQRDLAVVVQDHHNLRADAAGVIHRLPGHAAGDGAVADDSDAVAFLAQADPGLLEADRRADGGGRVASTEGIILGLLALGEAGEATPLAQGVDAIAAAREDLVRLALVRHIPADLVPGRVVDRMQCHSELDDTEAGSEVATGDGNGIEHLPPNLIGEFGQLRDGHPPHRLRALVVHRVQNWSLPSRKVAVLRNLFCGGSGGSGGRSNHAGPACMARRWPLAVAPSSHYGGRCKHRDETKGGRRGTGRPRTAGVADSGRATKQALSGTVEQSCACSDGPQGERRGRHQEGRHRRRCCCSARGKTGLNKAPGEDTTADLKNAGKNPPSRA
mmetsp:Transcript_108561/g.350327  ORF Transcript_108561/g.350327 Transcript_108561/m.350327 type:complete len:482 (+) Transcript_108561:1298-2743(+)